MFNQLKSTDQIKWNENKATFSGIDKSTINYWMNLPVPVFLVWSDIQANEIYFCSIKGQVRQRFSYYKDDSKKTMGFHFKKEFQLGTEIGNIIFLLLFFKERSFNQFISYLSDLLLHCEEYYDFIMCNQGRDPFLEVEDENLFTLLHICRSCRFLAQYLEVKWEVLDLSEAYKKDREVWKDPYCLMHESTISQILGKLQPIFFEIVIKAKELITKQQKEYWEKIDWSFYSICSKLDIEKIKRKYE